MHAILADIPGASTAEITSPLARVKENRRPTKIIICLGPRAFGGSKHSSAAVGWLSLDYTLQV